MSKILSLAGAPDAIAKQMTKLAALALAVVVLTPIAFATLSQAALIIA